MTPAEIISDPRDVEEVLGAFTDALDDIGYAEITDSFFPRSGWTQAAFQGRLELGAELARTIDLLMLCRTVEAASLPRPLLPFIDPLCELGILQRLEAGTVRMPDMTFSHMLGLWLFLQREVGNPSAYFGDDTIGLACRVRAPIGGTSLDFCAGPGTQGLIASRTAKRVTLVETNPVAAAIARLNVAANRASNVTVLWADLATCKFSDQFDHVTANPPLLPVPQDLDYPFVGNGGEDGLSVTRKILARLPELLKPTGRAQIIGVGLGSDKHLSFLEPLQDAASQFGLGVIVTVVGRVPVAPGTPYFDGLVQTVVSTSQVEAARASASYSELILRNEASQLCSFALQVTHGDGAVAVHDLSKNNRFGLWQVW